MKKLVVLVSGNGSNLQAIIDRCHNQNGMTIRAVMTNKADVYGLTRAKDAGIDAVVVPSKGITDRGQYDSQLMATIDEFAPDLIVLAGFMRILTPEFVRHYHGKMLNIHPSLLPKYPGLNTHQRAMDAGDNEHGTSVHFVTEELDGGPVILQARVPIFEDDTVDTVFSRVQEQEHRIYPLVVEWFCQGRLTMEDGKAKLDAETLGPLGYAAD
ncbi:phosphoribosylglycinamide formyltransferase [Enterovibrio nigricans]|uniref:Phosphoribosylglycinamide formyltransferase n=1 Tax=Enterovibrio nigricans DSM 22720 TaxID=1121868 RepID=A0A1T4UN30_9GAMM|nr:phosphoribosylglycinamide formyltransferase [Enterovibrio nigricans]PKF50613.1 phosphoribosylglycinamide formyltransferase [Enterovibrio nigricans]SKA54162.1 phosphoribosylglycinamide formyltransferase-1 [Enterovibrio nigricans DSM 22720]